MNVIERLRENVETMLEPLAKKADLTPAEIENATKAMCLLEKIREYGDGDMMDNRTSRMGHRPMYYDDRRRDSRGRYSRHSIHDRMIAKLEEMMDEAKSDYERHAISDWISRLDNETD